MLGLKRHTVEIVEHQSNWIVLATDVCQQVELAGGNLLEEVQHVGSTAVPELRAKPILDIAAGIKSLSTIPELVKRLTDVGYIYRGNAGNNGGHLFVWESSPNIRTIHLHVVKHQDRQWNNYLLLRDVLCQNSEIREQYAQLKKQLKNRYPNDRKAYTSAKCDFIEKVINTQKNA